MKEGKWDQARFWDCRNSMQARRDKKSTQFTSCALSKKTGAGATDFFPLAERKLVSWEKRQKADKHIYAACFLFEYNFVNKTRLW